MEENKKKILDLVLKLREIYPIDYVKVKDGYAVFTSKGAVRDKVVKVEEREIEVDGQRISIKIEEVEHHHYEEVEEQGWLLPDREVEEYTARYKYIYVPLDMLKKIYGEDIEEVLKNLDIEKELERLEKEKEEEQRRKEREEYVLLDREMMMYYYGSELLWKGIKVRDREDAVSKLKEIENKYQLSDEESFNGITVKEFVKDKARIYVVETKGLVIALRDDSWSLLEFIRGIINKIDEGVKKDIGEFEKKVIEGDKIIYYFSGDKGVRKVKILVPFVTRLDQHAYEIEADVIWRKAEIPLSLMSKFIKAFIKDGRYRSLEK